MLLLGALRMLYHLVHRSWFAPVLLQGSSLACRLCVAPKNVRKGDRVDQERVCLPREASAYSWQFGLQLSSLCRKLPCVTCGVVTWWQNQHVLLTAKHDSPAMSSLTAHCCMLPSKQTSGLDPAPSCLPACAVACCDQCKLSALMRASSLAALRRMPLRRLLLVVPRLTALSSDCMGSGEFLKCPASA